jgi:hypothetical protein
MDEVGLESARGGRATATISENVVPTATDWDALEQYIYENDALYLMQRRLSASAWRELIESGEVVPGTEPYTQRSISLRKRNSN